MEKQFWCILVKFTIDLNEYVGVTALIEAISENKLH